MSNNELLAALRTRKAGLEALDDTWRLISDVMDNNIIHSANGEHSSTYLPQGRLEPASEYSRRCELTPFFPQTPAAVANRLGSLFRNGLQYTNASTLQGWIEKAGLRHQSLDDIAATAAQLVQMHGYCAALLDSTPDGARTYVALYAAPAILDWQHDADGDLLFVKFGEDTIIKTSWDGTETHEQQFRIIDRHAITVYHVTQQESQEPRITIDTPKPHGQARVPVTFCHPFPGNDGIGRPILERLAQSDISATRVLSDLVWDLFLLGNPILTLTTTKRPEELQRINASPSRYIPLDAGKPNQENAEKLEFVQLDPTGIELLFKAHELMSRQGLASATGHGADMIAGAAIPREQSGVAQAWRFKTGEERILFMLARSLEQFLNQILEIAAYALGAPPATVKLPEQFDDTTPPEKKP